MDCVVRPIARADLPQLLALARALGPGMTTLPVDARALEEKVELSLKAFAAPCLDKSAQYLLVGHEVGGQKILGVSALYTHIGQSHGFFSFKVSTLVRQSRFNARIVQSDILSLANDYTGLTEVGSLAVLPEARRCGVGRLLARARYMLLALAPERFASRVIAEMRGWQDEGETSPFWDAVGAKFFDLSFAEADKQSALCGAAFFADLFPTLPIYAQFLPEPARAVIGRPHASSALAFAMLQQENFRYERMVDIFDAGPQVVSARAEITTVAQAETRSFADCAGLDAAATLVSSNDISDFRVATLATARATNALGVAPKDDVLASPPLAEPPQRAQRARASAQTRDEAPGLDRPS
jgi:arginine N-succinyltransferase